MVAAAPLSAVSRASAPSPSAPSSITEMSPSVFVHGLAGRGLTLALDGNSDALVLKGPVQARTDQIRRYLRERKPQLIAYLKEQAARSQSEDDTDAGTDDDPKYGAVIGATYAAALADAMPKIRVDLGEGRETTDPNSRFRSLVESAKALYAEHGGEWRDAPGGEQIASDMEMIAYFWQRWYWENRSDQSSQPVQPDTSNQNDSGDHSEIQGGLF